jgi:nucleotide-binding universal stress UspA family protein
MKILLPVDGSPFTAKMLAYIGAHDEMFGKADEFVLVHVRSPVAPRVRRAVGKELVDKLHADETQAATKGVMAYFKQKGWSARLVTREGIPGDEIASVAESGKFDLVVMGSHGHGALYHLFTGSVVTGVLRRIECPVLVVPLRQKKA